jgi:hypothetical protein
MINHTVSIVRLNRLIMTSLGLIFGAMAAPLNASDPTVPSPQIKSQLENASLSKNLLPEGPATSRANPFALTLKGLVLRDDDHGTAIIALNETHVCVVSLQRDRLNAGQTLAKLGETIFSVTGFSDSTIRLQSLDGQQQFLVKPKTQGNAHVSF